MSVSPQSRDAGGEDREVAGAQARLNTLKVMELATMLRELTNLAESAIKDKTYQTTPIGQEVGRFLRLLQFEGKPKTTLDTYELPLAWLAMDFADFQVARFCELDGVDYLRDFLARRGQEWGIETKRNRISALRSFFKWQVEERGLPFNPAARIKLPRSKGTLRIARHSSEVRQLLDSQETLRDRCAIHLMYRLGLRKNDVRMLRVGDIDLTRNMVWLHHRKGDYPLGLPLVYEDLLEDLYLHVQAGSRDGAEYLLYPKNHVLRPMDSSSVHRWFKACLERADLPDFPMHELRHTAGTDIYNATNGNIVAAQQLLGHKSLETTRRYIHTSEMDLRVSMRLAALAWAESGSAGA